MSDSTTTVSNNQRRGAILLSLSPSLCVSQHLQAELSRLGRREDEEKSLSVLDREGDGSSRWYYRTPTLTD